jgi:prepilin-type N-terminal cleavage/methylation domain-containing protein
MTMNARARTISSSSKSRRGYTLVEVMIAVSITAIMAGAAVPLFQPNVTVQLEATGQVVAADLMRVRDLAVSNNSSYRLTFDLAQNQYYLEHTGTNAALNTLPSTIYLNSSNTATRQYTKLDDLPHIGVSPKLHAVVTVATGATNVTTVEFDALGATTASAETQIWLTTGSGDGLRYISLRIDPVTGLVRVNEIAGNYPYGSGSGS